MQFEIRTHHNHGTRRVVDTFTEQVFAETTLLTLDHIGQGFQRSVARTQHGSAATAIVKECIDSLLQHSLFIADDDFRRIEVEQFLKTVVSINQTTIEIIQVAGRKVSRIQKNEWTQIGWNYGNDIQTHPLCSILAVIQHLNRLESLDNIFLSLLALRSLQLLAQFLRSFLKIETFEQFFYRIGTHIGFKTGTVFLPCLTVFIFRQ